MLPAQQEGIMYRGKILRNGSVLALGLLLAACQDWSDPLEPSLSTMAGLEAGQVVRSGSAWGTRIDAEAGSVWAGSGPTAQSSIAACNPSSGSNSLASIHLSPVLVTGAVNTRADTLNFDDGVGTRTMSEVTGLSLLDGRITAGSVRAVSRAVLRGGNFRTNDAGSGFVDLRIDGVATGEVEAGARVRLPGLGVVILNEQVEHVTGSDAWLRVTMIRVVVREENAFGLPVGSQIRVSQATAGIQSLAFAESLRGGAHGTRIDGPVLQSAPTAALGLPCFGTDGEVIRREVAGFGVDGVLQTGLIATNARGLLDFEETLGLTTATVSTVNILNGLITADEVRARVRFERTDGAIRLGQGGSRFVNLRISGEAVGDDVAPNTRMVIDGVGTLVLRRVIRQDTFIQVRMIELTLDEGNPYDLTAGTRIRVSVAGAGLR
jgi:hypothetical protein